MAAGCLFAPAVRAAPPTNGAGPAVDLGTVPAALTRPRRIPVILDTDIGTDIDDTWALALLLRSPELDLKLVVTETGNTTYRAKVVARLLEAAGRSDVPIGIGIHQNDTTGGQERWVHDYDLSKYRGGIRKDGVDALIRTIMKSRTPMTLIAIGPTPNLAAALQREPRIAGRVRFVGMDGSIYKGYGGSPKPSAEYNITQDIKAAQKVFTAAWPMTITPLDTCGVVQLTGARYRAMAESTDPLARAVVETYRIWANKDKPGDVPTESSVLYDTVAVYLAVSHDLVGMERLGVRVSDDGFTRVDPTARPVDCATSWKDLGAYEDLIVSRITGKG